MSRIKSKEGARVHRAGYQPNLSRIRIRILKYLNTKILKHYKRSSRTVSRIGRQPKLKCYQGLSPLRPVRSSWEISNWPETRPNHFFWPSSRIKRENQRSIRSGKKAQVGYFSLKTTSQVQNCCMQGKNCFGFPNLPPNMISWIRKA